MFEGALALRYPDRPDLRFVRLGKPNTPIFEDAIRRLGTARAVMVGDTLETDITGARAAGLDAVWIGTGVTAGIPDDTPSHLRPTWRMGGLAPAAQEVRPVSDTSTGLPIGPEVPAHEAPRPARTRIEGHDVVLVPIDVAVHGPQLYALSHGPDREAQWMYLWDGPYPSRGAFLENLAGKAVSEDPFFFSIVERATGHAVGVAVIPAHHAEGSRDRSRQHPVHAAAAAHAGRHRGDVPDGPARLRHAGLSPLRVEVQRAERAVAPRGGAPRVPFEGLFRQHMIVKGRSRDTAWFAMIDRDWPAIRAASRPGSIRPTSTPTAGSARRCGCRHSPRRSSSRRRRERSAAAAARRAGAARRLPPRSAARRRLPT